MTTQFAPSTDTERKLTARAPIAIRAIATHSYFYTKQFCISSALRARYTYSYPRAVLNAIYLVAVALFAWFLSGLTFLGGSHSHEEVAHRQRFRGGVWHDRITFHSALVSRCYAGRQRSIIARSSP